jgi:hypothetical protein
MPEEWRPESRARSETSLAVWDGDFRGAFASLDTWRAAVAAAHVQDGFRVGYPMDWQLDLLVESGDDQRAKVIARELSASAPSWVKTEFYDLDLVAACGLARVGEISNEQFAHERDTTIARFQASGAYFASPWYQWVLLYNRCVATSADAAFAIAARPATVDPNYDGGLSAIYVGHTYLVAGHFDEAAYWLSRGTRTCSYNTPFRVITGLLDLADTEHRRGNHKAEHEALQTVLARWGSVSRSRTADGAQARLRQCSEH